MPQHGPHITGVALAALAMALAYLGVCAFAFAYADALMFPHVAPSYQDTPGLVRLHPPDRPHVAALHLPADPGHALVLYHHGNGEDLGHIRPVLDVFAANGFAVLAYDYPGYGASPGKPTEAGVYAASDAAYRHATQTLGYAPEDIVLFGRSIGGGPACRLAAKHPVRALVLDSAFSSAFRVMTRVKILPWDKFDNLARLPDVKCPVLLVHGKRDLIVPFAHALKNQRAVRAPNRSLWVDAAGHNDIIEVAGDEYWRTVLDFIENPPSD